MNSKNLSSVYGSNQEKPRTLSAAGFITISNNAVAAAARDHIGSLIDTYPPGNEAGKSAFGNDIKNFHTLFTRFLSENRSQKQLSWGRVKSPKPSGIVDYSSLPEPSKETITQLLKKLAVIKLNGGLGTTMGCIGPKSLIEVKDGMRFIDLTIRQIEYLNEHLDTKVPLILMNSFNTDKETKKMIQKYLDKGVEIKSFMQSRFPRIDAETLLPIPTSWDSPNEEWYPPGHGDMYMSLKFSGVLDELLAAGKEYIFVSNSDNLGATVDFKILSYIDSTKCEFFMEVTDKTKADIKGGTLMEYDDKLMLLEMAQVPENHIDEFRSLKMFTIFNTNNLWISTNAIKKMTDFEDLELEVIANPKETSSGLKVLQLETAVGAAIKYFKNAKGIKVPRSRFLPVKTTNDLFLITSDLYSIEHGTLRSNPNRIFHDAPVVKLGEHFKKVSQFHKRIKSIPHILDLDTLIISGSVYFGKDVTLSGTVVIVVPQGQELDIPSGSVLNDKVVVGSVSIRNH